MVHLLIVSIYFAYGAYETSYVEYKKDQNQSLNFWMPSLIETLGFPLGSVFSWILSQVNDQMFRGLRIIFVILQIFVIMPAGDVSWHMRIVNVCKL